jgi:phospholipase C
VPDDRANRRNLQENWGMSGFRIPGVVVSPWVKRGAVSHSTCMFESILKMISYRYALGSLNKRHRYAFNIGRTFNWSKPNYSNPGLPDPAQIAATPCSAQMRADSPDFVGRPKEHDLTALETSGYLDRLGFEVQDPTYGAYFRRPDTVRRAIENAPIIGP